MNKLYKTRSRFFGIWKGIKARVGKHRDYKKIKISAEWEDFNTFCDDMYQTYCEHVTKHGEKNTTIERIDRNGDYCRENCTWATPEEQANNRSSSKFVTFNGETLSVSQWARRIGVSRQYVSLQIQKGKPIEKIFERQISPVSLIDTLVKNVMSGKFGTKNRVELLLTLEKLKVMCQGR